MAAARSLRASEERSIPTGIALVDVVRHCVVDSKRISLGVRGDAALGYGLERRCQSPGEPVSVQHVDLQESVTVAAFMEHDPYAHQLGNVYRAVLGALDHREYRPMEAARPRWASECENERMLLTLMRSICEASGATNCFYHWFVLDEQTGDFESHHLLVGGAPAWAQRYVHRHWYLNDPAVAHARDSTEPLRGSALVSLPADHWLNQQAHDHGLCSNVFFPAHRRDDTMFGLLHVSAPLPAPQGEEPLWQDHRLLRGLANELLEWRVMQLRQKLSREFSLSYAEVQALRLVAHGGSARNVAEELKIGERAVYQVFTAINRKMNSKHIKSSASKAKQWRLLGEGLLQY